MEKFLWNTNILFAHGFEEHEVNIAISICYKMRDASPEIRNTMNWNSYSEITSNYFTKKKNSQALIPEKCGSMFYICSIQDRTPNHAVWEMYKTLASCEWFLHNWKLRSVKLVWNPIDNSVVHSTHSFTWRSKEKSCI